MLVARPSQLAVLVRHCSASLQPLPACPLMATPRLFLASQTLQPPIPSPAVCPPYELVDYNELFDLLEESPLLHEVGAGG